MFLQMFLLVGSSLAEPDPGAEATFLAHGYVSVPLCGNGGYCVPPTLCAPWYLDSLYDPAAPCYLAHGTPGVCCVARKPPCKLECPCRFISVKIIHKLF